MKGYVKDYRKELNSDIWSMPPLYHRVWQYLKYMVNHKANKIPMNDGSFLNIKPGQHLTSIRNIAREVGWYERGIFKSPNPKTISSILDWLEKQSMIKIDRGEGNRQYTLITLINWESYQSNDDESNSEVTVSKQSADINKNDKNDKKLAEEEESQNPFRVYEENFGMLKPILRDSLIAWCEDLGDDIVIAGMKLAASKGGYSFSYCERIWKEWYSQKLKTLDDVRAYELEKRNRKNNKVTPINRKKTAGEIDWDNL